MVAGPTEDENIQIARKCRGGIRRAKAENELKLARDTKSNLKKHYSVM